MNKYVVVVVDTQTNGAPSQKIDQNKSSRRGVFQRESNLKYSLITLLHLCSRSSKNNLTFSNAFGVSGTGWFTKKKLL